MYVNIARVYKLCSIFQHRAQVMNGIDRAVAFAAQCFFTVFKIFNTIFYHSKIRPVEPVTEQSHWFLISQGKQHFQIHIGLALPCNQQHCRGAFRVSLL